MDSTPQIENLIQNACLGKIIAEKYWLLTTLSAYFHSAATLNYMRSILSSGFADLHHPREWPLSKVRNPTLQAAYDDIVTKLEDALDFLGVIGGDDSASDGAMSTLNSVDLFTSHEASLRIAL